jgi:hypothetical protein
MKFKPVIALAAVALGVSALVGIPSANATPAVFTSTLPVTPITAQAYNLIAVGALVNIPPVDPANCGAGQNVDITAPSVSVPKLATVYALASTCLLPAQGVNLNTQATASAAKVSLLNGAIVLTGVRTQCFTNPAGFITAESTVATINGAKVSVGSLNITIPGIATIALDQNSQNPVAPVAGQNTTVRSVGALIQVLPHTVNVLGKPVNIPAQTISVDTCSITGSTARQAP